MAPYAFGSDDYSAYAMPSVSARPWSSFDTVQQLFSPTMDVSNQRYWMPDMNPTPMASGRNLAGQLIQPKTTNTGSGGAYNTAGSGFDQYNSYILAAANKYKVDPAYIKAIISVESGGNASAVSSAGARGLMQVMPFWASNGQNLYDPATNIDMGTKIIAGYLKQSGGDWKQALARYNGTWGKQAGVKYADKVLGNLTKYQTGGSSSGGSGNVGSILDLAAKQVGKPYVLGSSSSGSNPGSFDCSSLAQWAYGRQGIQLPRTAQQQYNATQRVNRQQLQPGDLVFFKGTDGRAGITHVGIYQGNGMMINAVSEGQGVKIQSIDSDYWKAHFAGGGRVKGVTGSYGGAAPAGGAAPQQGGGYTPFLAMNNINNYANSLRWRFG